MSYHLTPLEVCDALIGSPAQIATICGLKPKATYPWRRKSDWQEAGDIRAAKYMRKLLHYSRRHKLGLEAKHLIFGATRADVARILETRAPRTGAPAQVAAE